MAEKGYRTSTIYQTRITLFNMLEFARENDVICRNPCKTICQKAIWEKPSQKKESFDQRRYRRSFWNMLLGRVMRINTVLCYRLVLELEN